MRQSLSAILISLLLLWWLPAAASVNNPVLVPPDSFSYSIARFVSVYEDSSRELGIAEMLQRDYQLRFTPSHAEALKFGISRANYWLRFSVSNPYQQRREVIFTLSESDLALFEVFDISDPDNYQHLTTEHPARDLRGSYMQAYPVVLSLPPGSTHTYLLLLNSDGLFSTQPHLLSRDRFVANEQEYSLLAGIAFSWVLATLAFFCYVWFTRKTAMAAIGMLYCGALILYQPAWSGHLQLLAGASPYIADKLSELALALSGAAHLLAGAQLPWQGRFARPVRRGMKVAAGLQVPVALMLVLLWPQPAMLLITSMLMLNSLLSIPLLLLLPGKDKSLSNWLLAGHGVLFGGGLLALLSAYNLLALDLLIYWAPVVFPMLVMSTLVVATMLLISANRQPVARHDNDLRLTPALLSQISHELRSPINGVLGMHELLADTPISQQQRELADTIALAGHDLLHIVNEISETARLHNGVLELERQAFNPARLLTGLVAHFQQEASRKQVELVLDLRDDLPALVSGDPARLQLALHNLLARALAYTEQGEMALSLASYSSTQSRGIRLQIQLSSTVLKQEELKSAFQILQYQLPVPDSRNDKNWSLLLTRFLLQRMGALLEVESMTSEGASLTLFMPLPAQSAVVAPAPATDGTLIGKRVLIVDDSASLRAVLERQTKRLGMRPDSTYSAKEALAMLRNQINIGKPYDLIIMDHDMPVMNGLQLAARINQDNDISIKPARLMLTGINLSVIRKEAIEQGIQCLLSKPADSERLRQAMVDLLEKQS